MDALDRIIPKVGDRIGRYELMEELGRGGFGVVFRARQAGLDADVAIKLMIPQFSPQAKRFQLYERFEQEAKVLKRLEHPSSVQVRDYGRTGDGLPYLVMEYARGDSLAKVLRQGPLALDRTLRIGKQVLGSLAEAHHKGVIHRDLKPDNIIVREIFGEPDSVKVLDFGIAKLINETTDVKTMTGAAIGTPWYMSPEQARGRPIKDGRIDLYALGLILAECISGRRVVREDDSMAAVFVQANASPLEFEPIVAASPLFPVIWRATAKDPDARYPDALSMRQAVEEVEKAAEPARMPAPAPTASDPATHGAPTTPIPEPHSHAGTATTGASSRRFPLVTVLVAVLVALAVSVAVVIFAARSGGEGRESVVTTAPSEAAVATVADRDAGKPQPDEPILTRDEPQAAVESTLAEPSRPSSLLEGFVLIEAGTFTMGSPPNEPFRDGYEAQHEVTISRDFFLQTHEVTQGEWRALMGNNPSGFSRCGEDCPVDMVTWFDALAYANALSRAEGTEECYVLSGCSGSPGDRLQFCTVVFTGLDCAGYRLPTEAEWEYAARAGHGQVLYDGSSLGVYAWYAGNSGVSASGAGTDCRSWEEHPADADRCGPQKVQSRAPNPWGLYDMLGNVTEWVWDMWGEYPGGSVTDPLGSDSERGPRVQRGGDWRNYARSVRIAFRDYQDPNNRHISLGFRLARTAP